MESKILFIRFGSFSHINNSVYNILKSEYAEHEIDVIDILDLLKKKTSPFIYLKNCIYFIREYGMHFLAGKKDWNQLKGWFFSTSYIALHISNKLQKLYQGKEYKFSLQTQSLYNGKLKDIPNFIYTDHTNKTNLLYPDISPQQYMRSKAWIKKSETLIYEDATMIFTFGNLVRNSLINHYNIPKEKIVTVYSGSNVFKRLDENKKKHFSKNILFVGMEWERKGGPILLEVFQEVLKKHPDASLTIIGCSPKHITLPNIKILGKIPPKELPKYYESATIFCLPTLREPFGIVFVEAMIYKLPIVSNNIGALPDLVKNSFNGYLIDNDVPAYAEAITQLLDNPAKCLEMGQNGFEFARENLTWEKVGKTIKENIESVLEKTQHIN